LSRIGLVGGSYTSQSRNADDQLTMNLYPEIIESGSGKVGAALYPTPGTAPFTTLSDQPVRGQIFTDARAFAVGGSAFSEIFANGTKTDYGPIVNDGSPVSMAAGPSQILIASAGTAYVFDLVANTLTAIPLTTLTNVNKVGFCDGFFVACLNNSHTFQASALEDATSWPPLSIGTINVFVDNVLSMLIDHREVWLFGITKTAVYYDAGLSPFPFDLIPGAFIEQGIGAPNSPVRLDNSIFWLGGDERGNMVAWRAQGYTPTRVSNHAVEFAWQSYPVSADAVGYSYQDQGHSFWVLYFPTANKTWVFDAATGQWHERGYWNAVNGIFTAHRSQNHIFAFGKHLVGDWASGKIYRMGIDLYTDGENLIRRVRRAPHVSTEQEWIFHHQLQVDLETGLGPQPPLIGPSSSPATIVLNDELGNPWTVTILDNGAIQMNAGAISPAQTIIINDSGAVQSCLLVVNSLGPALTAKVVTYSSLYPMSLPMGTTPSAMQTAILVYTDLVQTANPFSARDPQINLRWSDDGGKTFSNEYSRGCGQAGQFKKRVIWRRLGRSRDRVYELSMTDPVAWRILDADLKATPGFEQPTERLTSQIRKSA
jgi:hypothetical protein